MRRKIFALGIITALCGMAFVGCQKEEMPDVANYKTIITVKANDAKTHYNPDTHGVEWDPDDQISVINGSSSAVNHFTAFTLIRTDETGAAIFGSTETLPSENAYFAIYPAQDGLTISGGKLSCIANQPQQTLAANSFGPGNNTSVGWNSSTTMRFRNVGGLAKIALRGTAKIKSIKIANNGDDTLSGRGTIDVMDTNLRIKWDADHSSKEVAALAADQTNGIDVSQVKVFYISLPPCTLDNYTITITDKDGNEHIHNFTTRVTISRSGVTLLGAFEVNEVLMPTNYQIWYTAPAQITLGEIAYWGSSIVSHTFDNGQGVITFAEEITAIPTLAFENQSTITSVTLPASVISIGDEPFYNCSSLSSITMPGVKSIGVDAFYRCVALTSVELPHVESIGDRAFYGCSHLASVALPTATTIERLAFHNCTSLESMVLPNVRSIGEQAFDDCLSLTSVVLPHVESIGDGAFNLCLSLTSVVLPHVESIGDRAFVDCPPNSEFWIGTQTPPTLGTGVFSDLPDLLTVTIHVHSNCADAYEDWKSGYNLSNITISHDYDSTLPHSK